MSRSTPRRACSSRPNCAPRRPDQRRAADRHGQPPRAVGHARYAAHEAAGDAAGDARRAQELQSSDGHTTSMAAHHRPAGRSGRCARRPTPDGIYVDGTFGRGGHARALLARLSPQGRLVAFDKDPQAVAAATPAPSASPTRASRSCTPASPRWREQLAALGIAQRARRAARPGRQLAADRQPGARLQLPLRRPLDMRMDTTRGESAADFLARADERQIAEVIRDYGEERFAVQIAKALVARRAGRASCSNHRRTGRSRGWCGQDPRAGPGPCNAHISGSSDFRQRRA